MFNICNELSDLHIQSLAMVKASLMGELSHPVMINESDASLALPNIRVELYFVYALFSVAQQIIINLTRRPMTLKLLCKPRASVFAADRRATVLSH